jgi:hypothetical protein
MIRKTLFLLALFLSSNLLAADQSEGIHYQNITLKSSRHIEDKIEVAFFYGYTDADSLKLNDHLNEWLKSIPQNVYFIRRPSTDTQKDWALALSYTRAEMLGKGDQVNAALFKALSQPPPGLNSMQELLLLMESKRSMAICPRISYRPTLSDSVVSGLVTQALQPLQLWSPKNI